MNKQTVYIKTDVSHLTVVDLDNIDVCPVSEIENVYVLTEQELEEIILKAWKQSRDGIIPTQTVNNILTNK